MTNEDAREIIKQFRDRQGNSNDDVEALDLAIKALEQQNKLEIPTGSDPCDGCRYELNSTNGNPCYSCGKYKLTEQQPNYLKKRDGNYVHYNVEWLLKNWQMELDILSDGKIKPCEDCISRADVLALAEKGTLVSNGNYKSVCKAINDLPSVTPKAEWIPVSERLPEDYIHVLCQFTLGGMGECYLAHGAFHVVGGLVMTCNEVIAWMPLPELYKIPTQTFGCAED